MQTMRASAHFQHNVHESVALYHKSQLQRHLYPLQTVWNGNTLALPRAAKDYTIPLKDRGAWATRNVETRAEEGKDKKPIPGPLIPTCYTVPHMLTPSNNTAKK